MKNAILLILISLVTVPIFAQKLYIQSFGKPTDPAIIFLHGGPGYNASNFEVTTAQKLANKGFYVVVYDRRGEGRSEDANAMFTFEQTMEDLSHIYKKSRLKKAILMGHSFGGIVATRYAQKYPKKVQALILVGAPIAMQETFQTIVQKATAIYEAKNDETNLYYMNLLKTMDKASLEYSSYCFAHAMQNGFYSPKKPSAEAMKLYALFGTNTLLKEHASKMTYEGPKGFWKNEQYTSIDLTEGLKEVQVQQIPILGLYGKEDGLFSKDQITNLETLIGQNNLHYFDNCAHNVFIDQQQDFITTIKNWIK